MGDREPGPQVVWLVRHGESMGNVADAQAQQAGAGRLQLDVRDPDVPLSDTGRAPGRGAGQVAGRAARGRAAHRRAELAVHPGADDGAAGHRTARHPVRTDERLRERDFGAFDGMTGAGIREQFPDEAGRRDLLGKFYYRPPGGESWADVALRMRSLLSTEGMRYDCERLLMVAHQAVIMVFRYVLEGLTEQELLDRRQAGAGRQRLADPLRDRRRRRPASWRRSTTSSTWSTRPRTSPRSPMPRPAPDTTLVTPELLRDWPLPEPAGGKKARGSILVIGGSAETLGAVLLAAEAALRAGAGKLQVATAASVAPFAGDGAAGGAGPRAAGDRRRRDPRRRGRRGARPRRGRGRRAARPGDGRQGGRPRASATRCCRT